MRKYGGAPLYCNNVLLGPTTSKIGLRNSSKISKHTAPNTVLPGKQRKARTFILYGYDVKAVQENCLNPEDGAEKLSRNVGN
jgi:hypothetical protein